MRRFMLAFVSLFALVAFAGPAEAKPRYQPSSTTRGDGTWTKTYGWGGYGWYSINGDFVGTDGYTYVARRYVGTFLGRPVYFGGGSQSAGSLLPKGY